MNDPTKKVAVPFGYNAGVPDGIGAAWGARFIVTQDGTVDSLHDRQGVGGDETEVRRVLDMLVAGAGDAAKNRASELLVSGTMLTRAAQEFVLYHNGGFIVKGNTNASHGYLYVVAYFEPEGIRSLLFPSQGDPENHGRDLPWINFIRRVNTLAAERGEATVFGSPERFETSDTHHVEVYPEARVTHYLLTKRTKEDTIRITTDSERAAALFDLASEK